MGPGRLEVVVVLEGRIATHVASATHARLMGTVHGHKLRLGIITELLRCRAELWLCLLAAATPGRREHNQIDL